MASESTPLGMHAQKSACPVQCGKTVVSKVRSHDVVSVTHSGKIGVLPCARGTASLEKGTHRSTCVSDSMEITLRGTMSTMVPTRKLASAQHARRVSGKSICPGVVRDTGRKSSPPRTQPHDALQDNRFVHALHATRSAKVVIPHAQLMARFRKIDLPRRCARHGQKK